MLNVTNILEDSGLNIVYRNVVVFFVYNANQVCLTTFCVYYDSAEEVKDLGVNVALSMLKFYKSKFIFAVCSLSLFSTFLVLRIGN